MIYSIKEIAKILNLPFDNLHDYNIEYLLTDSRSLVYPESTLFFALHTNNNDGAHFISSLYDEGVRNFVVCSDFETSLYADANFLQVDCTLAALQQLAGYHRQQHDIDVIGITGSRGKTVVKEWLNQLLHSDYRIVRSPRSFNSQIGVPLSLWEINDNTNLAIVEAGISKAGEMNALKSIINPTIGIFTTLGDEHSQGFDSIEKKCLEKCSLLSNCKYIVYNSDNKTIDKCIKDTCNSTTKIAWSTTDSDAPLYIADIANSNATTTITYKYAGQENKYTIPLTGDDDIMNSIHCLATMLLLNISPADIASRMLEIVKVKTRLDVIEASNNCLLVCDSYVSDYNSLAPALDFMARRATKERTSTVILSDVMNEAFSNDVVYRKISDLLNKCHVTKFIGIGNEMLNHRKYFGGNAIFFASTQDFLKSCSPSDFIDEQILIKGLPEYNFNLIVDMLEVKRHETVLEVNLDALAHNFNFFRSKLKPETKIVCMVKAKGYGAGSYEIAKTLQDRGADYLAVAVLDEGIDLRKAGITMPIMVLNPIVMNYKAMFANRLEPEIFSIDMCKEIIREAKKFGVKHYPVHIKLDTGMHRLGFLKEQLPELIELLHSQDNIYPSSVFSHLATADCFDMDEYTKSQFAYYDECCAILQSGFDYHITQHILNTAGIIRFTENQHDMVRLGIGLYGIPILNDGSEDTLRHISSLHTVIISIKEWDKDVTIGYSRKETLNEKSRIATIPIGYADGLNRHLGNRHSSVYVNGTLCPIVGNICMDVCMIDVTNATCKVGDTVEIFGDNIPVSDIAKVLDTIPYEVLTSISERVKRIYYRE